MMLEVEDVKNWIKQWFYDKDEIDDLIGDINDYIGE